MPSQRKYFISPLLISKKGTGHRSGSNSIQQKRYKCLFRTALLQKTNNIIPLYTGDGRTPVGEGMLHFLSVIRRKQCLPASLSVEAAVVLPLFIAAMCLLMYPMRIMNAQIEMQLCMEQAGELVSVAEGVKTSVATSWKEDDTKETATKETINASTAINTAFHTVETIGSGAAIFAGMDWDVFEIPVITELKVPDEEDPYTVIHVTCLADYPLAGLVGKQLSTVKLVSRRRAWVGREGGAGRAYGDQISPGGSGAEEDQDSQKIVYVARNSVNSGRYHTKATCHYISNTMTSVNASAVSELRSSDGGKYHACPSCRPGTYGTVYIFKSGDAYHASKYCKAIQSFAVEVTLKEAKERGLTQCTYCSRSQ